MIYLSGYKRDKMKYVLLMISAGILLSAQCKKEVDAAIPVCIQQKIDSIKGQPKWNPPAEVKEYRYNGKRVFLFSADCCDQYNLLVDAGCNLLCAPSGGFTGKGDGACTDFNEKAVFIREVWKDER